jgi:hypothetical protein
MLPSAAPNHHVTNTRQYRHGKTDPRDNAPDAIPQQSSAKAYCRKHGQLQRTSPYAAKPSADASHRPHHSFNPLTSTIIVRMSKTAQRILRGKPP